jgi:hypothetical protein
MDTTHKRILVVGIIFIFAASVLTYSQLNGGPTPTQAANTNSTSQAVYKKDADGVESIKVGNFLCATGPMLPTYFCCDSTKTTKVVFITNMTMPRHLELSRAWENGTINITSIDVKPTDGSITANVECDGEYQLKDPALKYWIKFLAKGHDMRGMIYDQKIDVNPDPDCIACLNLLTRASAANTATKNT